MTTESSEDAGEPVRREPPVPAERGVRRDAVAGAGAVRRGRRRPARLLGRARPASGCTGSSASPRRSTGPTRRSRSGSSAAGSTSPTTASTGTSRPATATGSPSTWRASPATPAPSPTPTCSDEVCQAANALTDARASATGDRVAIYLPMIPEAVVAMLACARIGAAALASSSAASRADALRSRIQDAEAKLVITADGGYRRGKPAALKPAVDEAVAERRRQRRARARRPPHRPGRRRGPRAATCGGTTSSTPPAAEHDAAGRSTPSTRCSSSTPRAPPGSRRASCTPPAATSPRSPYTHHAVFDLKPETDVYWCTADIGWVTGHSYIVYGPLANGATQVMYEGTPDTPHRAASGRSSRSTASRSSTPRRPRSARS